MDFDLIIIGAGPGGYEMAAMAAKQQLKVAVVEKDLPGGTCLNRGCIPTKALCRNAEVLNTIRDAASFGITVGDVSFDYQAIFNRKNEIVSQLREGVSMLLSNDLITVINGTAEFTGAHAIKVNDSQYTADNIVIATGSAPKALPIEGATIEGVMTSDEILAMDTLPKSLCIIGGGVIGMEFAGIFSSFGVDVTVVEFCKEILPPFDKDVAKRLKTVMSKRGVNIITSAAVKSIAHDGNALTVSYDLKGKELSVECEKVLMSVGRKPVVPQGLDKAGVTVGRRGIEVDDNMETSVKGIYAIGDVNGRCMLAHAATAQGERALNAILKKGDDISLDVIPSAVFTTPELSMVGLTEEQCKEKNLT